jgi:hypothetical protein
MGHKSKGRKTKAGETPQERVWRLFRRAEVKADRAYRLRRAAALLLPWEKRVAALKRADHLMLEAGLRSKRLRDSRLAKVVDGRLASIRERYGRYPTGRAQAVETGRFSAKTPNFGRPPGVASMSRGIRKLANTVGGMELGIFARACYQAGIDPCTPMDPKVTPEERASFDSPPEWTK